MTETTKLVTERECSKRHNGLRSLLIAVAGVIVLVLLASAGMGWQASANLRVHESGQKSDMKHISETLTRMDRRMEEDHKSIEKILQKINGGP